MESILQSNDVPELVAQGSIAGRFPDALSDVRVILGTIFAGSLFGTN